MKKIIFIIIFFVSAAGLFAQEAEVKKTYKIGLTLGAAYMPQSELRDINRQVEGDLPFAVKTINNFPPYFCYGGYILSQVSPRFAIGPGYWFYTTGSRLGARDYSGSYSFDQILTAHSFALNAEWLLPTTTYPVVYLETIAGANLGNWKMEETLETGGETQNDVEELEAVKLFFYPGLKFTWPLNREFGLGFKLGYSFDLAGKFHLAGNAEAKSDTKAGFSGPRLKLVLEYGK